jgi:hypothetical protein
MSCYDKKQNISVIPYQVENAKHDYSIPYQVENAKHDYSIPYQVENAKQTENQPIVYNENINIYKSSVNSIYSIFHTIITFIAIYLSYKCHNKFDLGSFIVACFCPYIYIIYILATKGTCDSIDKTIL